ncbi:MAG: flagellar biosynthetic protein FliQ [Acidimicrobiales bacterium]
MTDSNIIDIAVQTLLITAKLASPIMIVTLVVGFAISLVQSVTQVQEMTLTFVPKLIGVAVVMMVSGNWMMAEILSFTRQLFDLIPTLLQNT